VASDKAGSASSGLSIELAVTNHIEGKKVVYSRKDGEAHMEWFPGV
jgi:hypothetical protein